MRVPSAVQVPSLQNVRNMQTPTAAGGERESFSVAFLLGTVESNKLPWSVQSMLQGTVRGEDLVLAIKVAGLPVAEDREQIAGVCRNKVQNLFRSYTKGNTKLLYGYTNAYTNTSTCSPKTSTTYFYWATTNDDQKKNMKHVLWSSGLKGFARDAFGAVQMRIPERGEEGIEYVYAIAFNELVSSEMINLSGGFSTPSSASLVMRRTGAKVSGRDQSAASAGAKRQKV
jgi:hypothetical protein